MIPAATYTSLRLVKGLKSGGTDEKESKPVKPIAPSIVFETLAHMGKIPSDMVRIQMLTGCRPGEVCMMRPCDIDRSSEVWLYTPKEHKTEHAGKVRVVFIGPEAQAILTPYLSRPSEKFCFSP
ncbi:MAG: site-specific integrase, partial [Mariniblastus sp.]|nr:site-specific integrase [Mariniblastus sp.]